MMMVPMNQYWAHIRIGAIAHELCLHQRALTLHYVSPRYAHKGKKLSGAVVVFYRRNTHMHAYDEIDKFKVKHKTCC